MTLCTTERFCKCGSELLIEYAGDHNADSAVVQMFDQLHTGADCGPVSPQMAAIARSKMTRRELQLRKRRATQEPRENTVHDELPRDAYELLFPDATGIREDTIAGALRALQVPQNGIRVRARDAWVEVTAGEGDGVLMLRLLTQLGGANRAAYADSIEHLRAIPEYLGDSDETFNPSYASFWFRLPDTISVEVRAEMAVQAPPMRELAVEAAKAKAAFAAMANSA